MKKINVIVKDQYTLVLQEDAKSGDYIDLQSLQTVDTRLIQELIKDNKDKEYNKQLDVTKNAFKLEKDNAVKEAKEQSEKIINDLKLKINDLENKIANNETNLKNKFELQMRTAMDKKDDDSKAIEQSYNEKYNQLKMDYEKLKESFDLKLNLANKDNENKISDIVNKYETKLTSLSNQLENKDTNFKLHLQTELEKLNSAHIEETSLLKDDYAKQIDVLKEENNQLKLLKSTLNVKQTGEDLEAWCDNEVNSHMQNGLFNCVWKKDNDVVKEKDETKGTKADYIFSIYDTDEHEYLLSNICFDMKDENPSSTYKKHNSDYYETLDKNRRKKNCKYAVLISNLDSDRSNELPIFKVTDPKYKDMYVVRPQYLMVFINLIVSLTMRFKEMILEEEKENQQFLKQEELSELFESLKNTYLDKPLELLEKQVNIILDQTLALNKASDKIKESANKIIQSYINEIEKKLNRFNIRKLNKELDNLE